MIYLRAILAAFATWRVAQFIVFDDGPFDTMLKLRTLLGRYNFRACEDNPRMFEPASGAGRLLECVHCVGKWVAVPFALLVLSPTWLGDFILLVGGLAGVQSLIEGKRDCYKSACELRLEASRAAYKAGKGDDDDD